MYISVKQAAEKLPERIDRKKTDLVPADKKEEKCFRFCQGTFLFHYHHQIKLYIGNVSVSCFP